MLSILRFTKTSMLVLLAATLTTAAYAGGGGHAGSNGSMGAVVPVHTSAVQSNAHIGPASGSPVAPKGNAHGCPGGGFGCYQVRDHRNQAGAWQQGEGGLSAGTIPSQNQTHQTGPGGQVNDHRTVVHDHRN